MRINRIQFRNLNSLKGEFNLDFKQHPSLNQGLVLITGPTGAGKSTILDALCLGLYGATARSQQISTGNAGSIVVSHGSTEAMALVEFSLSSGQVYQAEWTVKITRGGNDQTNQFLAIRDEKEASGWKRLLSGLSKVKAEVNRLIQLDLSQFLRSVILAQGQFSLFLERDPKARAAILERVSQINQYREISMAAFERERQEKEKLDQLSQERNRFDCLSPTELAALQAEQSLLAAHLAELEQALKRCQEQRQQQEQAQRLAKELAEQQARWQSLQDQWQARQSDFERLERHLQCASVQPSLAQWEESQDLLAGQEKQYQQAQEEEAELAPSLSLAQAKSQELQQAWQSIQESYQAALPLWEKVNALDRERERLQKEIQQLSTQNQQQEQSLGQLKKQEQELSAKQESIQYQQRDLGYWLEKHESWAALAEGSTHLRLQELHKGYEDNRQQTLSLDQASADLIQKIQGLNLQAQKLGKKAAATAEKQAKLEQEQTELLAQILPKDQSESAFDALTLLENRLEQWQQKIKELESFELFLQEEQQLLQQMNQLKDQLEQQSLQLERLDNHALSLETQRERSQTQQQQIAEQYAQSELLMHFLDERDKLQDQHPCPLCGSKEHPYIQQEEHTVTAIRQKHSQLKSNKKKLEEQHKKLDKETQDNRIQQNVLSQQIRTLQKQLWDQQVLLGNKENQKYEWLLAHSEVLHAYKQGDLAYAKGLYQAEWEAKRALRQQLQQQQKEVLQVKQVMDGLLREQKELEFEQAKEQQQLAYLDSKREDLKLQLEKAKQIWVKEFLPFLPQAQDLSLEGLEVLRKQGQEYRNKLQQAQALHQQFEAIGKEQLSIEAQVAQREQLWEEGQRVLGRLQREAEAVLAERSSLFGQDQVEQVRQALLQKVQTAEQQAQAAQAEQQQLSQKQAALRSRLQILGEQIQGQHKYLAGQWAKLQQQILSLGLADVEALKAALLPKDQAQAWAEERQNLSQNLHLAQGQTTALKDQYQALSLLIEGLPDLAELQGQQQALRQEQQEGQERLGSLKSQIEQQNQKQQQLQQLLQRIEAQQREYQRWKQLYDLIGSKDGDKFSIFAQSITLGKLIQLANLHLRYFFEGRYSLVAKGEDSRLDFWVKDSFQANNHRELATLSGGERFLVSLSLSLGLADLASKNAPLDSLFIDEGFGALDQDILGMAMQVLNTLRNKGKNIVIISHVERMQQAIPNQIRVQKREGGFSDIHIVES